MKTILFFNNRYIDTLEGLKSLFKGPITDDLRRELLASFQDGIIDQWLSEGDEDCLQILDELSRVKKSDSNQTIETKLTSIFVSDSNKKSFASHVVRFEDHCQLQEVKACKIEENGSIIGNPDVIPNIGIKFGRNEYIGFQLFIGIKITNPDNEVMPIIFEVTNRNRIIHTEEISLPLNTKKNDIKYLSLMFRLGSADIKLGKIELKVNGETFWSSSLVVGSPYITLHLDNTEIPLSLVEGSDDIESFYMMRVPYTGGVICNQYPMVNVSSNEVMQIIENLNNKYKTKFRLPTVAEWQYAAKGGINKCSYIYSGGDDINEVASTGYGNHYVGIKKPNKLGLFDMSGNVWEMTSDISGNRRIICGGSHNAYTNQCKVDSTSSIGHSRERQGDCGFRLICDVSSVENLSEKYIEYEQREELERQEIGGFVDMGGKILWSKESVTNPKRCRYREAEEYAKQRGSLCRLPTEEEFSELFVNCTFKEKNGYVIFTSKINGNMIQFPYNGEFWTRTIDKSRSSSRFQYYLTASVMSKQCTSGGGKWGRNDNSICVIAVRDKK